MRHTVQISLLTATLCLVSCGAEGEAELSNSQQTEATNQQNEIKQTQIIYDAYNGAETAQTQEQLIPFRSGACNVYFAYESAFAYSGASVPVNVGYAYMTGDLGACQSLCAGWTKSYTIEPTQTKFVHRQLYRYPNQHMVLNPYNWSRGYYYNMECMVTDHAQSCTPVFYQGIGSEAYGTTYCVNDSASAAFKKIVKK